MRSKPVAWRRAVGVAAAAAYGPFVGTALWTLAFVDCGHCKTWIVRLTPVGPGLLATDLLSKTVGVRGSDWAVWAAAGVMSAGFVAAVAAFGRLGAAWLAGAAATAAVVCGGSAFVLLQLLRA